MLVMPFFKNLVRVRSRGFDGDEVYWCTHKTTNSMVQITTPASMKILFSCVSRLDAGLADSCGL
jgi:hypothetical protein